MSDYSHIKNLKELEAARRDVSRKLERGRTSRNVLFAFTRIIPLDTLALTAIRMLRKKLR